MLVGSWNPAHLLLSQGNCLLGSSRGALGQDSFLWIWGWEWGGTVLKMPLGTEFCSDGYLVTLEDEN